MTQRNIALITGASSGIGEALSRALAGRGLHVVLVARSEQRLQALAEEIRERGGRATVIPADLSLPHAARELHAAVARAGLEIDLLINNAGVGHYIPFEDEAIESLHDMLQVNVVALAELTRSFVPALLERKGTVLNVASTVAFQPVPFMSAYGASKAFVLSFSEALWAEYRGRGLRVAAVCPGPVETPFIDTMGSGVRKTLIFRSPLSIDQVVAACFAALDGKRPSVIVGLRNWLAAQASRFGSRALTVRLMRALFAPPRAPRLMAKAGE